jgi:hypothetical protein
MGLRFFGEASPGLGLGAAGPVAQRFPDKDQRDGGYNDAPSLLLELQPYAGLLSDHSLPILCVEHAKAFSQGAAGVGEIEDQAGKLAPERECRYRDYDQPVPKAKAHAFLLRSR